MEDLPNAPLLRRGLRWSGWIFVVTLILSFLDALAWLVLPQPYRMAIPALLALSVLVGITLLVGMMGARKFPGRDEAEK